MRSDFKSYRPAPEASSHIPFAVPHLDEISHLFTERECWGFNPRPHGPSITKSGIASHATDRDFKAIKSAFNSCALALQSVRDAHELAPTDVWTKEQMIEFKSIATDFMASGFEALQDHHTEGTEKGSYELPYYVLNKRAYSRAAFGDASPGSRWILYKENRGWTRAGEAVRTAFEAYESRHSVDEGEHEEKAFSSDEESVYEDAV